MSGMDEEKEQQCKPKLTAPLAELKTAVLLLDCCDFYVLDHSAVEGCRKGSAGVGRP